MLSLDQLIAPAVQVAQQVLPFKFSLDDGRDDLHQRPILFGPFQTGPASAVDVALASVHVSDATVLFDRILLGDGTHFPYAVAIRPDDGLANVAHPEPFPLGFDGPGLDNQGANPVYDPLFVNRDEGSGSLLLFVLPGYDSSGARKDTTELFDTLDQLGTGDAFGTAPVAVRANTPEITVAAPPPVRVGVKLRIPFSIAMQQQSTDGLAIPGPLVPNWNVTPDFDSSGDFDAVLSGSGFQVSPLELAAIRRQLQTRWGAEQRYVPVAVQLTALPPDGGGTPCLRLMNAGELAAGAKAVGSFDDSWRLAHGLPEYVMPRRPGSGTLRIAAVANANGVSSATLDVPVEVDSVTLQLNLSSGDADASGRIVIEDRWLADEHALVAGFNVKVSVPPDAVPPGESTTLWDSTTEATSTYINASVEPGSLLVEEFVVGPGGLFGPYRNNAQRSFRLLATIDDTSKAQFHFTHLVDNKTNFVGDFRAALKAVGPGDTTLRVRLLPMDDPLPGDCVQYDMPGEQTIAVHVPPPLHAELTSWEDQHFAGSDALDFTDAQREVIYKTGTVHALVQNHSEASTSEQITLTVQRPDGVTLTYDVQNGTLHIDDTGKIAQAVGDLAFTDASGENAFHLSAWKPINDVVGAGTSKANGSLFAVLPSKPDIAFVSPPGDGDSPPRVVRRTLPDVTWSMERATLGRLGIESPSTVLDQDSSPAYDKRQKRTSAPTLPAETGAYELVAIAFNDFGGTASDFLDVVAPAPSVSVQLSVPAGYADKVLTPNRVGHTVRDVTALVTVQYALSLDASGPGVDEHRDLSSDPFTAQTITIELPTQTDELAIGDNPFTFAGTNEFASTSHDENVNRRDNVYDFNRMTVELTCQTEHRTITADVFLNGHVIDHSDDFVSESIPSGSSPPVTGSPTPLGFDKIAFQILDDNGSPASSALLVNVITDHLVGPDYEPMEVVILMDPSLVVDDPDNNIPVGNPSDGRWLRVVRGADESGDIVVAAIDIHP